ncbi:MAG: hypothetical protein ACI8TF_001490 [Paracoccaceae bacterium]|jgi:hypothetical protein
MEGQHIMRKILASIFVFFSLSAAALACPTYQYTGQTYSYDGDYLYTPRTQTVVAGGENSLRDCGFAHDGYFTTAPDFSFNLSGMGDYYLVLDVVSNCDAALLVNAATTTWYYDDDTNGNFDPKVTLDFLEDLQGRVDVWVGTYDGQYCDAELTLETFLY